MLQFDSHRTSRFTLAPNNNNPEQLSGDYTKGLSTPSNYDFCYALDGLSLLLKTLHRVEPKLTPYLVSYLLQVDGPDPNSPIDRAISRLWQGLQSGSLKLSIDDIEELKRLKFTTCKNRALMRVEWIGTGIKLAAIGALSSGGAACFFAGEIAHLESLSTAICAASCCASIALLGMFLKLRDQYRDLDMQSTLKAVLAFKAIISEVSV